MELEKFIEVFAKLFVETDSSEIEPDTEYQELEEWSSVTAMSIMAMAKMEYGYFNAGVTLINLHYFREHNVSGQLMDYIAQHYDGIKYHDQDTLNAMLHGQTLHLMPQWNMTSDIYAPGYHRQADRQNGRIVRDYALEKSNAQAHKRHPLILHYVAKPKPWQAGCTHPLCLLYYHYAKQTIHFAQIRPPRALARWWAAWKYNTTMRLSLLRHDLLTTLKPQ